MSPKTHSTDVLTLLIAMLYSFCKGVILAPLNGPWGEYLRVSRNPICTQGLFKRGKRVALQIAK